MAAGGTSTDGGNSGMTGTGGAAVGGSAGQASGGTSSGGRAQGGSAGLAAGGAGGRVAEGGRAGTGRGGRGGGKGGAGSGNCDDLLTRAENALDAAQACDGGGASCRDMVDDPCGCKQPVANGNSAETQAYLDALDALKGCPVSCTNVACKPPVNTSCGRTTASAANRCVSGDATVF
jgi:hypothetical protein